MIDNNIKNFKKIWMNSLSFLDNSIVNIVIVVILFLYVSCIFDNINNFVGGLYNFSIVRIIVLLFIIYVAPKDTTIAVLLSLSYIISIYYMVNNEETFISKEEESPKQEMNSKYQKQNEEALNRLKMKIYPQEEKEHFFPLMEMNDNQSSFNINNRSNPPTNKKKEEPKKEGQYFNTEPNYEQVNQQSNKQIIDIISTADACVNNYNEKYEAVGDVCEPIATFNGELNPQGINFPMGFDSVVNGSPLN
jgi:c-di-AMP phosphodiesterase-like protein